MWWHDWLSIIFNILSIRSISKHATSRSHRRPNEKTLYLSLPPQWRGIPSRCKAKYKVHKSLIAPTVRPDETATKLTLNIKKENIYRNYVFKKHWGRNGIDFLDVPAPVFIFLVFLGKVGARKVGARLTTYQFEDFLH